MFPSAKNWIPHLVANLHKLCARAVLPREKQAVVVDSKKYEMLCIFARQKRDKKLCNVSFYEEFIPHLVANLHQLCAKAVLPREKQAVVVESKNWRNVMYMFYFPRNLVGCECSTFPLAEISSKRKNNLGGKGSKK